ncbi:MAG TPA: glycosyltransferase [Iamia sp.]
MQGLLDLPSGALVALSPFGVVGLLSWSVWFARRWLSHRTTPVVSDHAASASVIVPVYQEDPAILTECLGTWLANEPDELIVVVDIDDHACRRALAGLDLPPSVRVIPFRHTGKRSALGVGIRAATGDIVVLSDSDTAWTPDLLRQVQMPFADPRVGGVGTRQSVAAPSTSIWRRVAAWILDLRYLDYVPALGARGSVPCLSGRTAAYRRSVVVPLLDDLEHERFLGRECVSGDDGRLTWLVLGAGHRTVHQDSAHVVSMFPASAKGFFTQRLRWGRNSYRCYLTAAWKGWLWRQPLLTQVTVLQILLTPLTMGIAIAYVARALATRSVLVAVAYAAWVVVGRAIRGISHLRRHPRDLAIVPLVALVTVVLAVPLKLLAFVTMNRQGWLTRGADRAVPTGQSSASLVGHAVLS